VAVSSADIEPISKTVLTTMTRLHAEIMRSISHYRSQQAGNAPLRIYLCGGTSSTPQLREFFAEKLQLPIEFFDPLRRIALSRRLRMPPHPHISSVRTLDWPCARARVVRWN